MRLPKTGVKDEILTHVGKVFSSPPPGDFSMHGGSILHCYLDCVVIMRLLFPF